MGILLLNKTIVLCTNSLYLFILYTFWILFKNKYFLLCFFIMFCYSFIYLFILFLNSFLEFFYNVLFYLFIYL